MKIVVESHIPYLRGRLEPYGTVSYVDNITADDVRDASVLLVRTRTHCDEALLGGSKVRFIGSATIGTDHIDLEYCTRHGITVCNAPGCNAPAVAQWVLASIGQWMMRHWQSAEMPTLGIVGVGHVGSIVARWARQLGFSVLLNDPPRQARGDEESFVELAQLVGQSDIITFHTPLTKQGQWPTWHMCDSDFLRHAQRCRLLINAARGAVCDSAALLTWQGHTAIDCWENEPHISRELLEKSLIATPHIAGYSLEGKMRGAAMMIDALNRHFGWDIEPLIVAAPACGAVRPTLPGIMGSYNPLADTATLKAMPDRFEHLRNTYSLRPEYQ